jgi:hypothetical protein
VYTVDSQFVDRREPLGRDVSLLCNAPFLRSIIVCEQILEEVLDTRLCAALSLAS